MIIAEPLVMKEVVDRTELDRWKNSLRKSGADCPKPVLDFIYGTAPNLREFERYKVEIGKISGRELLLCGIKEWNGAAIDFWSLYDLPVPVMQATNHVRSMIKIYNRKGRQGLVDYCKARVKPGQLGTLMKIMDEFAFNSLTPNPSPEERGYIK